MDRDSQGPQDGFLGGPHPGPFRLLLVIVPQQVQDPVHDQQLEFGLDGVAGFGRLLGRAGVRNGDVAQIAREARGADKGAPALIRNCLLYTSPSPRDS